MKQISEEQHHAALASREKPHIASPSPQSCQRILTAVFFRDLSLYQNSLRGFAQSKRIILCGDNPARRKCQHERFRGRNQVGNTSEGRLLQIYSCFVDHWQSSPGVRSMFYNGDSSLCRQIRARFLLLGLGVPCYKWGDQRVSPPPVSIRSK